MPAKKRKPARKKLRAVVVVGFGFVGNRYKPGDLYETTNQADFDKLVNLLKIKPL